MNRYLKDPRLRLLGGPHEIERLSWPFWQKYMAEMDPKEHESYHSQYPMSARLHCSVCREEYEHQEVDNMRDRSQEGREVNMCYEEAGGLHGQIKPGTSEPPPKHITSHVLERATMNEEDLLQRNMEEQYRREIQCKTTRCSRTGEVGPKEVDHGKDASHGVIRAISEIDQEGTPQW